MGGWETERQAGKGIRLAKPWRWMVKGLEEGRAGRGSKAAGRARVGLTILSTMLFHNAIKIIL